MKKLLFLLVLSIAATPLFGQAISSNGGSIQGTVADATGASIPGAAVTITSKEIGYTRALHSDSAGIYSVGPLLPGPYVVTITAPGFSTVKITTVVRTGTVTSGNARLAAGSNGEVVDVNAGQIQINTDQIGVAGVVTREQIEDLPTNGRNILDIAQLQPGVILESGQSFDPTKAGYSAISVSGVGGRTTRILLDGQDITDETVGTTLFNVPSGAIGDFQLNRATQDVSGEVTSTGQVLMSTQSGTNSLHGQLFYNFQDHSVGFANVNGTDAKFQRNQFGINMGGPIIKDKLFFFFDAERLKQDEQDAAQASSLFADPTQILGDPYLTTPILLQYPFIPAPFRDTFATARLDFNGPWGVHLFARAVYSSNADTSNFGNLYSVYENRDYVPALVGGADFTTGHFTHSLRGGYEKFHNLLTDATAQYGSTIYNPDPTLTLQGLGLYAGINSLAPQQTYQSDKQLRYDGTWTKGRHSVKFGGEMNRIDGGGFAQFFGSANLVQFNTGTQFPGPTTANPNGPGCGGVAGAQPCPGDPLNGYSQSLVLTGNGNGFFSEKPGFGTAGGGVYSWRFAAYVADTWKFAPWGTMTAGVRWNVNTDRANQDLATPLCSQVDEAIQFPGCTGNTPLYNQYGSATGAGTIGYRTNQPYKDFGPQVGFVISPGNHKTSYRVGTGIYYENDIFNNTGNARPSAIQPTSTGAFFNYAAPCGNYFPGSTVNNPTGAGQSLTALCGTDSIAQASPGFADIRGQYQGQTKNVSVPNPNWIGAASGGDLEANGLYAGPYKTPYSIQFNGGIQQELAKGLILSMDYIHNTTFNVPLVIDVNRLGAARTLNVANAQAAIAATLAPNPQTGYPGFPMCPQGYSAASIDCAIANGADISYFAGQGLDSGNNGQNLGGQPGVQTGAAFPGINPNVGVGKFLLPTGKSAYDAGQVVLQQQKSHPLPGIVSSNLSIAYTVSRIVTLTGGGTEDQFFAGSAPWDYDNPGKYIGRSNLDHTNELSFGGSIGVKYGAKIALVGHFFSAPPSSLTLDSGQYGGEGEIFRTDVTGDGTVGDLLPSTIPGAYMHSVKGAGLNKVINQWNATQANLPTPAGQALIDNGLFTLQELQALQAVKPLLATAPTSPLNNSATRTFDVNVSYPIRLSRFREGLSIQPGVAIYNAFNMSNFGSPSGTILTQTDAQGAVNTTQPGYLAGPNSQFVLDSSFRVQRQAGTFDQGSPRSTEFQLRVNF